MSRSCWRCFESLEADAARCPACGARIIPLESNALSPASVARRIRLAALLGFVALGVLAVLLID